MNITIKLLLISGLFWASSLGAIKVFVTNYTKSNADFYINGKEYNNIIYPRSENIMDQSNMVTIKNVSRIDSLTATVNGKTVTINAPASFDQQRTALGVSIKDNNGNLVIEAGW